MDNCFECDVVRRAVSANSHNGGAMGKQIKLYKKESTEKKHCDTRFFFVKDQGEGAVRVLIIIFKLLEIILTTILAVCVGVIAPLSLILGEADEINYAAAAIPWIVSSVLYIIGLFLMIFNLSKIGTGVHLAAAVGTLVTYNGFLIVLKGYPDLQGPSHLYMPCLIITALSAAIMLMVNIPTWWENYNKKQSEKAPSILGDDD